MTSLTNNITRIFKFDINDKFDINVNNLSPNNVISKLYSIAIDNKDLNKEINIISFNELFKYETKLINQKNISEEIENMTKIIEDEQLYRRSSEYFDLHIIRTEIKIMKSIFNEFQDCIYDDMDNIMHSFLVVSNDEIPINMMKEYNFISDDNAIRYNYDMCNVEDIKEYVTNIFTHMIQLSKSIKYTGQYNNIDINISTSIPSIDDISANDIFFCDFAKVGSESSLKDETNVSEYERYKQRPFEDVFGYTLNEKGEKVEKMKNIIYLKDSMRIKSIEYNHLMKNAFVQKIYNFNYLSKSISDSALDEHILRFYFTSLDVAGEIMDNYDNKYINHKVGHYIRLHFDKVEDKIDYPIRYLSQYMSIKNIKDHILEHMSDSDKKYNHVDSSEFEREIIEELYLCGYRVVYAENTTLCSNIKICPVAAPVIECNIPGVNFCLPLPSNTM